MSNISYTLKNLNVTAPTGFDAIVLAEHFEVEGVEQGGAHYDYDAQRWILGADHAHVDEACTLAPLFCGTTVAVCQRATVTVSA